MANKDYYSILGVNKTATQDEIKSAFRKLAHTYHPDKGGGNEAKFKEISEAYGVLGDAKKRAQYDTYGSSFSADQGGFSGGGGFSGFDGFDFSQFTQGGGEGFNFDINDMFGDIFGGGSRKKRTKRGRDIQMDLDISFSESVFGVEKEINLTKPSTCDLCGGSGAEKNSEMNTCGVCHGKGKIEKLNRSFFGTVVTESVCEKCQGQGKIPKNKCHKCYGQGIVQKSESLKVKIPADVNNGDSVRLNQAGEAVTNGIPGDLYIKLHIRKDKNFRKEGKNIITDLPIKLSDALLGAEYELATLEGNIKVKIPEGLAFGEILRISNKGVPITKSQRGDLLIKITIEIPRYLSKDAKKKIQELKKEGL